MQYFVVKALHIIFVVSWFAALFYIVRLFIYHVEAEEKPEEARKVLQEQYKIMQRKLWYIIGWPAMVLTFVFGTWMLVLHPALLKMPFMHVKLALVFGLLLYHLYCQKIMNQLKKDVIKFSSFKLRLINEGATLFLVSIVFVVVLKNAMNWVWGVVGFMGTAVMLMIAVKWYKKLREKK
jgi:putative membrane protein